MRTGIVTRALELLAAPLRRPREPQSLLAGHPARAGSPEPCVGCWCQGVSSSAPLPSLLPATLLARATAGLVQGSGPPLLHHPAPSAHAEGRP